jgi:hypothetical protein
MPYNEKDEPKRIKLRIEMLLPNMTQSTLLNIEPNRDKP